MRERKRNRSDGGMTGYHPVGFIDLIAEMMKKKGSEEERELTIVSEFENIRHLFKGETG
jgi:hypothetical protein